MARRELSEYATFLQQGSPFQPAAGASVFVYTHNTTTQVSVFSAEVAGTTLTQPLTADSNGQLSGCWVNTGQYLDLVSSYLGGPAATQPVDIADATALGGGSTFGSVVATKTSAYSITGSDEVILADATSAAFTLTLPTAVGFQGHYVLKATNTNSNLVTVATTASQTIDGASTITLGAPSSTAQYNTVILVSDGANWRIV